jgi:hypothetical protein
MLSPNALSKRSPHSDFEDWPTRKADRASHRAGANIGGRLTDANNSGATSECGDIDEQDVIGQASPSLRRGPARVVMCDWGVAGTNAGLRPSLNQSIRTKCSC